MTDPNQTSPPHVTLRIEKKVGSLKVAYDEESQCLSSPGRSPTNSPTADHQKDYDPFGTPSLPLDRSEQTTVLNPFDDVEAVSLKSLTPDHMASSLPVSSYENEKKGKESEQGSIQSLNTNEDKERKRREKKERQRLKRQIESKEGKEKAEKLIEKEENASRRSREDKRDKKGKKKKDKKRKKKDSVEYVNNSDDSKDSDAREVTTADFLIQSEKNSISAYTDQQPSTFSLSGKSLVGGVDERDGDDEEDDGTEKKRRKKRNKNAELDWMLQAEKEKQHAKERSQRIDAQKKKDSELLRQKLEDLTKLSKESAQSELAAAKEAEKLNINPFQEQKLGEKHHSTHSNDALTSISSPHQDHHALRSQSPPIHSHLIVPTLEDSPPAVRLLKDNKQDSQQISNIPLSSSSSPSLPNLPPYSAQYGVSHPKMNSVSEQRALDNQSLLSSTPVPASQLFLLTHFFLDHFIAQKENVSKIPYSFERNQTLPFISSLSTYQALLKVGQGYSPVKSSDVPNLDQNDLFLSFPLPKTSHPNDLFFSQLTAEIQTFESINTLTQSEILHRLWLIEQIWQQVRLISPHYLLCVTGSFTSYTSLPTSDVDIVIVYPQQWMYVQRVQRMMRSLLELWYGDQILSEPIRQRSQDIWDVRKKAIAALGNNTIKLCETCGTVLCGCLCDCDIQIAQTLHTNSIYPTNGKDDDERKHIKELLGMELTRATQMSLDFSSAMIVSSVYIANELRIRKPDLRSIQRIIVDADKVESNESKQVANQTTIKTEIHQHEKEHTNSETQNSSKDDLPLKADVRTRLNHWFVDTPFTPSTLPPTPVHYTHTLLEQLHNQLSSLQTSLTTSQRYPKTGGYDRQSPSPSLGEHLLQSDSEAASQFSAMTTYPLDLFDPPFESNFIKSKIPLVKLTHSKSKLHADISAFVVSGIVNSDFLRNLLLFFPAAQGIILVLKSFLLLHNLNEPFRGGLGGYPLCLIVVSHLQMYRQNYGIDWRDASQGELLLSFFQLYGEVRSPIETNPEKSDKTQEGSKEKDSSLPQSSETVPTPQFSSLLHAISIRGKGAYLPIDQIRTSRSVLFEKVDSGCDRLIVEDPLDGNNNTTRSCYHWPEIKEVFGNAYREMMKMKAKVEKRERLRKAERERISQSGNEDKETGKDHSQTDKDASTQETSTSPFSYDKSSPDLPILSSAQIDALSVEDTVSLFSSCSILHTILPISVSHLEDRINRDNADWIENENSFFVPGSSIPQHLPSPVMSQDHSLTSLSSFPGADYPLGYSRPKPHFGVPPPLSGLNSRPHNPLATLTLPPSSQGQPILSHSIAVKSHAHPPRYPNSSPREDEAIQRGLQSHGRMQNRSYRGPHTQYPSNQGRRNDRRNEKQFGYEWKPDNRERRSDDQRDSTDGH
ncbi:putative non-canonical poly(A) RNA polymerase PAPD5/7 [Blattamonas nauphoetae]|uniref:Non-canonical poly(A) RNA polymerase PAPD5/7 n=1 Tax=Blattamonas nauphoetae TaxID=2049346 RepID=A0ABQ9YHX9_9EUKA|nr:putative non-canonical poly(A) RNA polymerase PAPD5/7 [Blattamonas nauphoetae]